MGKLVVEFIMLLLILFGVVLIYDARTITKNYFSFGDQNEGASGLKIFGFIFALVCALVIIFLY